MLGVARSGYYAWKRRPISVRTQQDQQMTAQIQTIFQASRQTYGSPRVQAELQAQGVPRTRTRVV